MVRKVSDIKLDSLDGPLLGDQLLVTSMFITIAKGLWDVHEVTRPHVKNELLLYVIGATRNCPSR